MNLSMYTKGRNVHIWGTNLFELETQSSQRSIVNAVRLFDPKLAQTAKSTKSTKLLE